MKNKKLLLVLAMVVFAAFVVAGCGSTTTEKKDSAPTEKKAETAGLMQTFEKSVHYTFFGDMVKKGPTIKDEANEGYNDKCMSCHTAAVINGDVKDAKIDDFFTGGKYADKVEGITCRVCHTLGGKSGIELSKSGWDVCGGCHIPGKNPDGSYRQVAIGGEAHHPQLIFIQGLGVKGGEVEGQKSKFMQVHNDKDYGCQSCHVMDENNHSFMVPGVTVVSRDGWGRDKVDVDYAKMKTMFDQKKCQTCHSSNAQQMVDNIKKEQTEIAKRMDALAKTGEELKTSLKSALNGPDGQPLKYAQVTDPKAKAYLEGETYYSYVKADSSNGAHNNAFAKALLDKADEKFKAAK